MEVWVGQRKLVLQPIDFVGEKLLGDGRYTCARGVTDELSPGPILEED